MINEVPTIFEVVSGSGKKQVKEKLSAPNHGSNKSKSNSKAVKGLPLYNPFVWFKKSQLICRKQLLCWSGHLK